MLEWVLTSAALTTPARHAAVRCRPPFVQLVASARPRCTGATATLTEPRRDMLAWLGSRVQSALGEAYGDEYATAAPMLVPASRPEFGDYQCNAAMGLAKRLKAKPRDVAETLLARLDVGECCEPPEIAGPGFVNLKLKTSFITSELSTMLTDGDRLGVARARPSGRVVVDYSSPNIAKEMHVGHLRSTVIGDCLARVFELRGHSVLRLNHLGDWGTQFGMLITHMMDVAPDALASADGGADAAPPELSDLVAFYKAAKARYDSDAPFAERARAEVVKLQAGDADSIRAWRMLCAQSEVGFSEIYSTLQVDEKLVTRGESFYNDRLAGTVDALRDAGVLEPSDGAQVVFSETFKNRDGEPQALIVQKSDGGYMYSTTDLAAVRQRVHEEGADRVLYVTDAGQAQHFSQVFEAARRAKLVDDGVSLEHVPFGLVLGEDGKKFKTRSGETVKLSALLDEARRRARADIETRLESEGREETKEFVDDVSTAVGIGAVKYADLAMNRNSNYRFSFDKMLSLSGNTAPYMLYACARISGIQRKAAADGASFDPATCQISLGSAEELALARQLLRMQEVIAEVERELLPSKLCEFAFETSGKFNQFYEQCPVLKTPDPELRASRLALCSLTASVLRLCLRLLGLQTLERL